MKESDSNDSNDNSSDDSSEVSSSSDSKDSQGLGENKIAGNVFGNGLTAFIDDNKSVISGVDNSDFDDDVFAN